MASLRIILISVCLHICIASGQTVSSQSFDEGLRLYQNEQYQEAAEVFSEIQEDRGALFAGKSYLALSDFDEAAGYLERASQSTSGMVSQEAQYTLSMVYYGQGNYHLALPLLYELRESPGASGIDYYANRFYLQILGYLTGKERIDLLHQIDSAEIRYDLFRYALDLIPYEELELLGNELLEMTPSARERNQIQSELTSRRGSDPDRFPEVPDGTIYTIGVILPVFAQHDPDFEIPRNLYLGIILAADEFNSRNSNRKIQLEFKNAYERNDSTTAAMEYLILDKSADAVIGPLFSEQAATIAPIADNHEVPLIIPLANSNRLSDEFVYSYQMNPSPEAHARIMAEFATRELGYTNLGILTESGTLGAQFARTFRSHAEQGGAAITRFVDQNFAASGYDLTGISASFYGDAEEESPYTQAIYAPFTGQSSSTMMNLLLNDMEANRNFIPILGSEDWKYGSLTRFQHQNIEIFYTEAGTRNTEISVNEFQQFNDEYQTRFGSAPDQFSLLGFDVASYLFSALETAGNPRYLDRVLQQDSIYEGLSIRIDLDEDRVNRHLFVRPLTEKAEQLLEFIEGDIAPAAESDPDG